MLICLGGGATQAAVMAMYGIVAADTLRAGGIALDEAIVGYVRKKYGLIIGRMNISVSRHSSAASDLLLPN